MVFFWVTVTVGFEREATLLASLKLNISKTVLLFGFIFIIRWQDVLPLVDHYFPGFPHSCRCRCCCSCCCCSRKSTPRCPCSSRRRSPRLLSASAPWPGSFQAACASWPVYTPGLFTPCLTGTWDLETLLHTDQVTHPYLGTMSVGCFFRC